MTSAQDFDPTTGSLEHRTDDYPFLAKDILRKNVDGSPQTITTSIENPLSAADGGELDREVHHLGINGSVVAKIESTGETFYLLQPTHVGHNEVGEWEVFSEHHRHVRENTPRIIDFNSRSATPLALVYVSRSQNGSPELSLRDASNPNAPVYVGGDVSDGHQSSRHKDRFSRLANNPYFSREHFSVSRDGDSIRIDVTSSNPTDITYVKRGEMISYVDDGIAESEEQRQARLSKLNERLNSGASVVEYDENGLIKFPDFAKSEQEDSRLQGEQVAEVPEEVRKELGADALDLVQAAEPADDKGEFHWLLTASDEEVEARSKAYIVSQAEEQSLNDKRNRARTAADNKYNQVKELTGDDDKAQAAADRVWKNFGF